jgi:uncharacterized protein (DUF1697 family)
MKGCVMARYVALLGGINVGGHRVKMEALRAAFEVLGFNQVATFIASGNVIFETDGSDPKALKLQIEAHLKQTLGYAVPTFLRTPQEIKYVVDRQPFPEIGTLSGLHTLTVLFLDEALPEAAQQKLQGFKTSIDAFYVDGREIYWLCQNITTQSLVQWPRLYKTVGLPPNTARNITSLQKLCAQFLN